MAPSIADRRARCPISPAGEPKPTPGGVNGLFLFHPGNHRLSHLKKE